jgi:hypothetical protein
MSDTENANSAENARHASWQVILFACLGTMVGAASGIAFSVYNGFCTPAIWILGLIGGGLFGWFAYVLGKSREYSTVVRLILIPFVPPVFLMSFVGLLLGLVLLAVISPVFIIPGICREMRFRDQMKATGRYVRWSDLLPLLESGQGTLIEESSTSGPFRIWYTSDDLLAKGKPISTDKELIGVFRGKLSHLFNSRCLQEYLDPNNGTALATNIRPRFVKTDRFKKRFPHVNVVPLIRAVVPPHEIGVDQP